MDRKVLSIILGLAFIASFFLPYLGGGMNISGFDIIQHAGASREPVLTYIWLIFPLSGLMLLLGALNKGNYPGGRALWCWLPLLALIYVLIIYPLTHHVSFGDIFKQFGKGYGVGLWIALAASVIGVVYNPRA